MSVASGGRFFTEWRQLFFFFFLEEQKKPFVSVALETPAVLHIALGIFTH